MWRHSPPCVHHAPRQFVSYSKGRRKFSNNFHCVFEMLRFDFSVA